MRTMLRAHGSFQEINWTLLHKDKRLKREGNLQDRVYKVLMAFTLEMETMRWVHSLIKITVNSSLSKLNIYRTSKLLESPASRHWKRYFSESVFEQIKTQGSPVGIWSYDSRESECFEHKSSRLSIQRFNYNRKHFHTFQGLFVLADNWISISN